MPPKRGRANKASRRNKDHRPDPVNNPIPAEFLTDGAFPDWAVGPSEPAAKKKVGRQPAVPENLLWGRCGEITYLLEVFWPRVGWQLQCMRGPSEASPDAVRLALEPLRGQHYWERIALLLRPSSVSATSSEVRQTFKNLGELRTALRDLEKSYYAQRDEFDEARLAVHHTSKKHGQQLKKQITGRIGNRVQLQKECADKLKLVTTAEKKLAKTKTQTLQQIQAEVTTRRNEYNSCRQSLELENKIISELKTQFAAATKNNWLLARSVMKDRLKKLKVRKAELTQRKKEVDQLDALYQDQASGFARGDLLKFLSEKRSLHQPRQLAKAIAGLPEMGCRESFMNCRRFEFQDEPHLNYQIVEVIQRAWGKRSPDKTRPLVDLVRQQIRRIPKTRTFQGERVPNFRRQFLLDKFSDLRHAIESVNKLPPQPHPGEVPYLVATKFLEYLSTQKTVLERVLPEHLTGKGLHDFHR